MGLFERLFGRRRQQDRQPEQRQQQPYAAPHPPVYQPRAPQYGHLPANPTEDGTDSARGLSDEQAIARYRYMLRTAPPEVIEQAHEEAFSRLTPEQRAQVLKDLSETATPAERERLAADRDDPRALARLATRAEIRRPGVLERLFGGMGPGYEYGYAPGYGPGYGGIGMGMRGIGMGGSLGGSLLASIAGGFIGSMIANEFFENMDHRDFDASMSDQMGAGQPMDYQGDMANAGFSGDPGAYDPGYGADAGTPMDYTPDMGADPGSDFGGDLGGDMGGDFGGDMGGDF